MQTKMTKKIMLVSALSLTIFSASAQDFKVPLKNTWTAFDTTEAMDKKLEQCNKMMLISKKWNNEWITHFYASLCKTIISYGEKDETKHDALLDDADKEHEEAVSILGKENDETYVLAAMIANSRMMINPMQRWQKYGKLFSDNLENAKSINENNPRIYYMKGVTTFHTPKAYGGGKKAALPYLEKAEGLFAKETDADITKPYWGKAKNAFFLEQAKQGDKE